MALFPDYPDQELPQEIIWTFMVQGKITEADTPIIREGATASGLIIDTPPSSHHFYATCPSCHNPPTLLWLVTRKKYAGLHIQWCGYKKIKCIKMKTRMWANSQPDGRPAKHRWRPLFNAAKFG